MCATSNSTLSNHQRYYYSLYAKSLTPLSCNLGLPRIRYSFLLFKISSKQSFQPAFNKSFLPSSTAPIVRLCFGSSRSGHQSGFSYVSELTGLDTSNAWQLSSPPLLLMWHKLQPKHDPGISITNTAFAILSHFLLTAFLFKLKNIIFLTAYHAAVAVHLTSSALSHLLHRLSRFQLLHSKRYTPIQTHIRMLFLCSL